MLKYTQCTRSIDNRLEMEPERGPRTKSSWGSCEISSDLRSAPCSWPMCTKRRHFFFFFFYPQSSPITEHTAVMQYWSDSVAFAPVCVCVWMLVAIQCVCASLAYICVLAHVCAWCRRKKVLASVLFLTPNCQVSSLQPQVCLNREPVGAQADACFALSVSPSIYPSVRKC